MYKINVDYNPSSKENDLILRGIYESHKHIIGEPDKHFSIFLRDETGEVFGGASASLDTQSVYIDLLWVSDNLRGKGYGKQLIDAVEEEGRKTGCIYSMTDTWDFRKRSANALLIFVSTHLSQLCASREG